MTSFVLSTVAVAMLAGVCTRLAAVGIANRRQSRRLRRRRLDSLSNCRKAAEIARLDSELHTAGSLRAGQDWRVMEVAEVVQESADCKSFYLVDPYGQDLPGFRPEQYVLIRPAIAGAKKTTRCYSL